jgi:probable HAF family extracellular repeat protein
MRTIRRAPAALAASAVLVSLAAAPAAAATRQYRVTDLGTLGGISAEVYAINDAGVVVGRSLTAGSTQHGFVWRDGVMTDLGALPGGVSYSEALSVNESGVIAGDALDAAGDSRAVIWRDGRIIDLGVPRSFAWAINDRGQVLGQTTPAADGSASWFIWQGGRVTDRGALTAGQQLTGDFNNRAQFTLRTGGRAAIERGHSLTVIAPVDSYPNDIDTSGAVAGYTTDADYRRRPFVYRGGHLGHLGTLGGPDGVAAAINDRGDIAGNTDTATGENHPTLWHHGSAVDLSTRGLLGNEQIIDLNNRGQMVAAVDFRAVVIR